MPESASSIDDELTFKQVQALALFTTKLFYAAIDLDDVEGLPFLKGTSFENQSPTTEDRYQLIAELSRKLIKVSPRCSTAIKYLGRVIELGAPFLPQDLIGTKFENHFDSANSMEVASELYRKVLSINPRDSFTIYYLSMLIMSNAVSVVASDLLGTSFEGELYPEHLDKVAVGAALTRKVMDLYKVENQDFIYRLARKQLVLCFCVDQAELTEEDLEGTPFQGEPLDGLNCEENCGRLKEWIEKAGCLAFTSISNALARVRNAQRYYLNATRHHACDLASQIRDASRSSMVSPDKGIFYQLIKNHACENFSRRYLEVDYIKQEYLFMISRDLTASAIDIYKADRISRSMLLGSQQEHYKRQVNKYELMAEFCRKAMALTPTSTDTMRVLALSIRKGIKLTWSDFEVADAQRTGVDSTDRAAVVLGLYKKAVLIEPYNKAALEDLKSFMPPKRQIVSRSA